MSLDKTTIREIRHDVEAAINGALEKHGLTAKLGKIGFNATSFSCKLEANANAEVQAEVSDAERKNWQLNMHKYGLTIADFGKTFVAGGQVFTVSGLKTSRPKYPITAKNSKGTSYKFTVNDIL